MFKVGITGLFTATHSLAGDVPEHEKQAHSHDYKLEWTLEVEALDERGFSLDISVLEKIRDLFFTKLNGQNLNENAFFFRKPVSLENLCSYSYEALHSALLSRTGAEERDRIASMEIRIWENDQAWAGILRDFQ